jgi:hypothetical protein
MRHILMITAVAAAVGFNAIMVAPVLAAEDPLQEQYTPSTPIIKAAPGRGLVIPDDWDYGRKIRSKYASTPGYPLPNYKRDGGSLPPAPQPHGPQVPHAPASLPRVYCFAKGPPC